jgi:hypothetical protein
MYVYLYNDVKRGDKYSAREGSVGTHDVADTIDIIMEDKKG